MHDLYPMTLLYVLEKPSPEKFHCHSYEVCQPRIPYSQDRLTYVSRWTIALGYIYTKYFVSSFDQSDCCRENHSQPSWLLTILCSVVIVCNTRTITLNPFLSEKLVSLPGVPMLKKLSMALEISFAGWNQIRELFWTDVSRCCVRSLHHWFLC